MGRQRFRGLLVISECTISLLLLIAAGLLIRSFVRLQQVPPGFATDGILTMHVAATGPGYRQINPLVNFYQEIGRRIAALPGVQAQGAVSVLPLTGSVGWGGISVEGYQPAPGQELQVDIRTASTDYFRTIEIPLIQGRYFSDRDDADRPRVVIIDEKFAKRFWPHESAVGKHLWFDSKKPITIVGVVGVVKQYGLDTDSKIATYFPENQNPDNGMFLAVRSSGDAAALAGPIVREIHAVDRDVAVYGIRTMQDRLYDSLARQRFSSVMLGGFAAFALVLAAVGIYGVMSYLVTQGTHDIGLRMALGAQPGDILRMVVRQGMQLAAIGIAVGLVGASVLTRVMASLLFGVSTTDVITFSAVTAVLAAVALAATVIPARRATLLDPIAALREE